MALCWYCHWGWSKPVYDIFKVALDLLDGNENALMWGPAHIVWSDENFDSAEWCIEHFEEFSKDSEFNSEALAVVRQSLELLAALPIDIRCPEPEDYDGHNPDEYPPPSGTTMVYPSDGETKTY